MNTARGVVPDPAEAADAARVPVNVLSRPTDAGYRVRSSGRRAEPPVSGSCVNQEVRTVMTVVAMGVAHNRKNTVPTPVVTG